MSPNDAAQPGFDDMALFDMPSGTASVREAARRRPLQARFLRAGRESVDDRDLLQLLLSGRPGLCDAGHLAASLLEIFDSAPCHRYSWFCTTLRRRQACSSDHLKPYREKK